MKIQEALLAGEMRARIADRLNVSPSTVTYHAGKLGLHVGHVEVYDWVAVKAYLETHGVRESMRHFGMSSRTWDKAIKRGVVDRKPRKRDVNKILTVSAQSRNTVKRTLRDCGVLDRCDICKLSEWLGAKLNMHLDHINGEKHDNRRENLRLLCPNCHSQTPTYGGRNVRLRNKRSGQDKH